ncbi:unnamed protein product [Linum tenue]|uniref:Cellulose synthase-like protein H1 n=1 Tax=Linum tenue TaxID=586396 RepID=A0AAV0R2Z5_9ROSI|nr:unnamed protein product [Linum tenue]
MAKADRYSPSSSPLYERFPLKYTNHRILDVVVSLLLASLLLYRLLHLHHHGIAWLIALSCESWFAFFWLLAVSTKWTPAEFKTYPERLSERVEERGLPAVDMFVTTADPVLEPPIITVNTVLSLMAVDYPVSKLACYVSDDGCSPLTYYSLVEASKFARLWVPFCKKYNVHVRAPFRYFSVAEVSSGNGESSEFRQECEKMKEEYGKLCCKIEEATGKQPSSWDVTYSGDLAAFAHVERRNHPTIIKVIWENKYDTWAGEEGLPHLVYISREKHPEHPHHYRAGAMNVLTRVSGVMTNAPLMLNMDCDMYANNPLIVRYAMCVLLDARREEGFVQFPQSFYGALKDDPFGNQLVVLLQFVGAGISGIQGAFYGGTGCFHRRKVIYGLCPVDNTGKQDRILCPVHGEFSEKELLRIFGTSIEFAESAGLALKGHTNSQTNTSRGRLLDSVEVANQVAGCNYESSSNWGKPNIGWQYGSTTEDVLTGLGIHTRGWSSVMCNPYPVAFLGCAPTGGPASLTQQKRWATGLLEILISGRNPLISVFTAKLQFRQCLAYLWINNNSNFLSSAIPSSLLIASSTTPISSRSCKIQESTS